jgi:hypothetical protein
MDDNKFAVAESVKTLLSEYANHVLDVERQIARDGLARNRMQFQERKQETRRKIIVGGAVLAEARTNPKFGTELFEVLSRRVTDERDRRLIAFGPSDPVYEPTGISEPSEAKFTAEAERRLAAAHPKSSDQN